MEAIASRARITAVGAYVPERIMTNNDLEKLVETSDDWIVTRTGMRERRISGDDEFTSHLCERAVRQLVDRYGKTVEDVDFIIVCTTTPDHIVPSVASQIQHRFNIAHCGAIDINATCAGFTYGLHLANGLITAGLNRKVLVIGGETLSKATNYKDRNTCILFGDGAGAVLVESDERNPSFVSSFYGTDGEGGKHIYRTHLAHSLGGNEFETDGFIHQNGREVFKWAVTTVTDGIKQLAEAAGMALDDIDWIVPHSANLRILDSIAEKLDYPIERILHSLEYYGNTSSASIPLAIDLAVRDGRLTDGKHMILYGFGGGLVHYGMLVRWELDPPVALIPS